MRLHPRPGRLVEGAILHDREQAVAVLQDRYVSERVAADEQEIGVKPSISTKVCMSFAFVPCGVRANLFGARADDGADDSGRIRTA